MELVIHKKKVGLKNLDKVYFQAENYLKGDIIDYYLKIAPYLLPHLADRPMSLIFFPEGKVENSFYQKQRPTDTPPWVDSVKIPSKTREFIDYIMINDLPSLIHFVNKSVLEMHAWFSRAGSLDYPDLAVIDLDPSGKSGIREAAEVAKFFHVALEELSLFSMPKTSGSRGLHILIPIETSHSYTQVQEFLQMLCNQALRLYPDLCTTERLISKRGDRIYLDAVQCAKGKTIAVPYSMRVKSGALVSTPLLWDEVSSKLDPQNFNIKTIFKRIDEIGDLSKKLYSKKQILPTFN